MNPMANFVLLNEQINTFLAKKRNPTWSELQIDRRQNHPVSAGGWKESELLMQRSHAICFKKITQQGN